MGSAGSTDVMKYRRCLAVQRVAEGYSTQEVADFLDVDPSTKRFFGSLLLTMTRYGPERA